MLAQQADTYYTGMPSVPITSCLTLLPLQLRSVRLPPSSLAPLSPLAFDVPYRPYRMAEPY